MKNYLNLFEKCVDTVGKNSDNHSIGTKQRKTEIMSYKVKDIIHENGRFWVLKDKRVYVVLVSGVTHSIKEAPTLSMMMACLLQNFAVTI